MIFAVNGKDLSACVLTGSYKVNENDIYDSYVDANGHEHRNIYRTKVSGTFDMMFRSLSAYLEFVTLLADSKKVEGYYPVKLAVNNTGRIVDRYVYIEFGPARDRDDLGRDDYGKITVTVEEF